jgi:hypothetical protein
MAKKSSTRKKTKVKPRAKSKKTTRKTIKRTSKKSPSKTRKKATKRSTATRIKLPDINVCTRWDGYALSYTLAILFALDVLFHVFAKKTDILEYTLFSFSNNFIGILSGMAEAAIYGIVIGFFASWLYNKFL